MWVSEVENQLQGYIGLVTAEAINITIIVEKRCKACILHACYR